MHEVRMGITVVLLISVVAGLARITRGPTLADRMLVAQLFCTTAVAVLLLLATDPGAEALRDVALVFTLLAPTVVITFARYRAPTGAGP